MRKVQNSSGATPRGALKLKAAANYLSILVPSIHRLVERGLLKPNRCLRHMIFSLEELERVPSPMTREHHGSRRRKKSRPALVETERRMKQKATVYARTIHKWIRLIAAAIKTGG
jgi:hypothetical protein